MVEMITRLKQYPRTLSLLLLGLLAAAVLPARTAGIEPRIPGLEGNKTYMDCLQRDARLQARIDSLTARVVDIRRRFRDDPDNRDRYATEILNLEETLFTLRSEKGALADSINTIEQQWIFESMDAATPAPRHERHHGIAAYADAPRHKNLVANACFRGELPESDYAALQEAQRRETAAAECIETFVENYARLLDLQERYNLLTEQGEADETYEQIEALQRTNSRLGDSLSTVWSYIFDNKTYAYGLMLDRYNRQEVLERETARLAAARRDAEALQGRYASDAVVGYFLQKQALVGYERAVAREFDLAAAQDSLAREADYLQGVDYRLPRVAPERRYLLDYEAIDFPARSPYTAANPIPPCTHYDHGTIYRIRVGRYKAKQAVSIFHGATPLAWERDAEGRYCYYAGGFATEIEARVGCELLLKHGFRRPEIVRWTDGEAEEVAMDAVERFRMEITASEKAEGAVARQLKELAGGREIARVGSSYLLGLFDTREEAEAVAAAVTEVDAEAAVTILTIQGAPSEEK